MRDKFLICFILCSCGVVVYGDAGCWMKLNAPELFKALEKVETRYAVARKTVQNHFVKKDFDQEMRQTMVKFRGAAQREIIKPQDPSSKYDGIPAGLHLGGRCMIRLPDSVLFFHRMKLRNYTSFYVKVLHNDIENMVLRMHMSLRDLHMQGAYERTMTDRDPAALIYSPSFGELELLLKDVEFTIEGRYRLIKSRLVVEVIISELKPEDILLMNVNGSVSEGPMRIKKNNLGDFIERLKTDLNKWLQDYINDYLIFVDLEKIPMMSQLQKYDKEKSAILATFMDNAINTMTKRIQSIGGSSIKVPQFSIVAAHGLKVKIYDGILHGLDTMYRRSVVTTLAKNEHYRHVNSLIGFSDLKVRYKYEISFPSGSPTPTLTGVIILTANELIGHLDLGLIKDPEVVEIDIDFLNQLGPDCLTVEGSANLVISNFKHLLNQQILSIMSNTVIYGVEMLRSLPRCEPFVPGQLKSVAGPKFFKLEERLKYEQANFNIIESEEELKILRQFKKMKHSNVTPEGMMQTRGY